MRNGFSFIMRIARLCVVCIVMFAMLAQQAFAASGSGTIGISPTSAVPGSTGNTFTMTYTAAETISEGGVKFTMPTGWSAPQLSAGTAGRVTATSSGTLGTQLLSMDSVTGWTDTSALISLAADTSVKKQGTASIRAGVTLGGGQMRYSYGSAQNWSSYDKLSFWFRSSSVLSAGDLDLVISENADGSSPVSYDLPTGLLTALSAGAWYHVVVDLSGQAGTTRDAVRTVGFELPTVSALSNFYFDSIGVGPYNVPIISGQTVEVPIMSLNSGGTVTLAYGAGGGASGVTVPSLVGNASFTGQSNVEVATSYVNLGASATVGVGAGVLTEAEFTSLPVSASAGIVMDPVVVTLKDALGNTIDDDTTDVEIDLATGSGTLLGTTTVTAVNGIATFSDLAVNLPQTNLILKASIDGISDVLSDPLDVLGVVVNETSGATTVSTGGDTDTISVELNAAPLSSVAVTLAVDPLELSLSDTILIFNSGNWNVPQDVTVEAALGATVTGQLDSDIELVSVSLDARFDEVLIAPITVTLFEDDVPPVTPVATELSLTAAPSAIVAGEVMVPPFTVAVLDQDENILTTDSLTAVSIDVSAGPVGAAISGTSPVTAVAGIATFSGLSVNMPGSYVFELSASGLPDIQTSIFNVTDPNTTGAAETLEITGEPSEISAGHIMDPFTVEVLDDDGDIVSTDNTTVVDIEILSGPSGAALSGTTAVTASAGVAEFDDLSVDLVGSYTFRVTASGLASDISTVHSVIGAIVSEETLSVEEGGVTDTYEIVLTHEPTDPVTVELTVPGDITINVPSVTFDDNNWNVGQQITVVAFNDTQDENDETHSIIHEVLSADGRYDGVTVPTIAVSVEDNDGSSGGGGGGGSGGSGGGGGGGSTNTTRSDDVDGDGKDDTAKNDDKNSANGYEHYSGSNSKSVLTIDGDGDGKMDHFIDTNKDGVPDKYWDPDSKIKSPVVVRDVNNDGTPDWEYDADGDGKMDHYYDRKNRRIVSLLTGAVVPVVTTTTCPLYGNQGVMVKRNSRGEAAKGVQMAVNQMNIVSVPLLLDGWIGPISDAGIRMSQQAIGTKVDGLWGNVTQGMYAGWVAGGCKPFR